MSWVVHIPMGLGARLASTVESPVLIVSGTALERLTVILQVHKKQVSNVTVHSTHTHTEWLEKAERTRGAGQWKELRVLGLSFSPGLGCVSG